MNGKNKAEIKLPSIDDLFGGAKIDDDHTVTMVSLRDLYPFSNHPYRVLDDAKMEETVESIKKNGVLIPGIVRPREFGGYEIIAGHRRKRACELAGLEKMPVFIKEMDDDTAAIFMVDTNIHREDLLFSEKAWAYRIKYDAMKHQGKQNEGNTAELIGQESGESGRNVKRYIRLTYLEKDLLELIDKGKINFVAGVNLSYLSISEQAYLIHLIKGHDIYPSADAAAKLKNFSSEGSLSEAMMEAILLSKKKSNSTKMTLSKKVASYFPAEYSKDDIERVLIELLEAWKGGQTNE